MLRDYANADWLIQLLSSINPFENLFKCTWLIRLGENRLTIASPKGWILATECRVRLPSLLVDDEITLAITLGVILWIKYGRDKSLYIKTHTCKRMDLDTGFTVNGFEVHSFCH